MTKPTKINSVKNTAKTKINKNISVLPDLSGIELPGGYKVESRLNIVSGEADLYLCSTENSRDFVLKIYRREDAVKNDVLETLKSVKHKNIGAIIAHGEYLNHSYVILPYYNKGTIADLVSNGGMDISSIKTKLLPQLIEGLNAIHNAGLLHRDLKPSNIMLDDEGNLVIIDFGISSITDGRSVLFTNTGMTPEYLAPEAFSSNYLVETDYYALGIILYELHTGHTPYKNISPEQAASYASVQKIPFDDSFDKDLKELILGLTYKDISNRHEKNNPNRRWTYTEVKNWLDGKKQQIPGSAVKEESYKNYIPYKFAGCIYESNHKLVEGMLENWNEGIKEVGRGFLSRHYDLNNQEDLKSLCDKAEKDLQQSDSDKDVIFFNLMYSLCDDITALFWRGMRFDNLVDYGTALIDDALKKSTAKSNVIDSSSELISNGLLLKYSQLTSKNDSALFPQIITYLVKLNKIKPLNAKLNALRIGDALTGKESFKLGNKRFDSIEQFKEYIDNLYKTDINECFRICTEYQPLFEELFAIFKKETVNKIKNILKTVNKSIILADGKYCFHNIQDIQKYVQKLSDEGSLFNIKKFWDSSCKQLIQLKSQLSEDDVKIIDWIEKAYKDLYFFDEYAFKGKKELIDWVNDLKDNNQEAFNSFVALHKESLKKAAKKHNHRLNIPELYKLDSKPPKEQIRSELQRDQLPENSYVQRREPKHEGSSEKEKDNEFLYVLFSLICLASLGYSVSRLIVLPIWNLIFK